MPKTETKFTPGPWHSGHMGNTALWIAPSHDAQLIAKVPWDTPVSRDNARENAYLIAAAPEMYVALNELRAGIETLFADLAQHSSYIPRGSNATRDAMTKARTALAKAEGEL